MINKKVVVVIGGAGLLGIAFCKAIAKSGSLVVVADINFQDANVLVEDINSEFSDLARAACVDIMDKTSILRLIEIIYNDYGRIDSVVNNAYPRNKNYGRKLEDVTFEDFCENVDMHLGGYFLVAQQFCLAFKN